MATFSHAQAGIRTQTVVRDSVQSVAAPWTLGRQSIKDDSEEGISMIVDKSINWHLTLPINQSEQIGIESK